MTCPVDHATLVAYWAHDLDSAEVDALEEHLFACTSCADASAEVASLARGLAALVPPVVIAADVAALRARGHVETVNSFQPGVPKEARFAPEVDLLLHSLAVDLTDVARVAVEFQHADGTTLLAFPDVPFEADRGEVVIACQRHFEGLVTNDTRIVVRTVTSDGVESEARFHVDHIWE